MKKSTLNPNAKEFNPAKPLLSVVSWVASSVKETGTGVKALEGIVLATRQKMCESVETDLGKTDQFQSWVAKDCDVFTFRFVSL